MRYNRFRGESMAKFWGFDRLIDEIDQIMATNDNYIRIEKEKQNSLKKLKKRLGKHYELVQNVQDCDEVQGFIIFKLLLRMMREAVEGKETDEH